MWSSKAGAAAMVSFLFSDFWRERRLQGACENNKSNESWTIDRCSCHKNRAFAEQHYCKPNLSKSMDAHPQGEGPRGPALQHRTEYNRAVSCNAYRFIRSRIVMLEMMHSIFCSSIFTVSVLSIWDNHWTKRKRKDLWPNRRMVKQERIPICSWKEV